MILNFSPPDSTAGNFILTNWTIRFAFDVENAKMRQPKQRTVNYLALGFLLQAVNALKEEEAIEELKDRLVSFAETVIATTI